MGKVIVLPLVDSKLKKMLFALHDVKYFASLPLAEKYIDKIKLFIKTIPGQRLRKTRNPKYGQYYCVYKANSRTSYFITFDMEADLFLIKNIFNNHTADYPRYIRGLK
jgi:hypothetical protein